MTNFNRNKIIMCAMLLMGMLLTMLPCFSQEQDIVPEKISSDSEENSNVRISTAINRSIYAIWQGKKDSKSHIFFTEKTNASWQTPIMVDDDRFDDDFDPALYVDSQSNPHIVWVGKFEEMQEIHYAYRLNKEWIFEKPIRTTMELNLEIPSILVTSEGLSYITWQEGKGIAYSIWCAFRDKNTNLIVKAVSSPDSDHYNIYPQLFNSSISPIITWYEAGDTGFMLRSAVYIADVGAWISYPLEGLERLPSNRLPILYPIEKQIFALWYDNIEGIDRVLCGRQDSRTQCQGTIVDDGSTFNNSLPDAVTDDKGNLFVCWRADLQTIRNQIFTVRIMETVPEKSILVSDGMDNYYSDPEIDIDSDRIVHIIWYSNAVEGGDGAVYYASVRF